VIQQMWRCHSCLVMWDKQANRYFTYEPASWKATKFETKTTRLEKDVNVLSERDLYDLEPLTEDERLCLLRIDEGDHLYHNPAQ
jgi:hypothetical protein